jgi:hypothetical protein
MTENIVTQITLDCLINREIYDKHNSTIKNMKINKKDKKFYRKRILNLTRELLLTKKDNNTNDMTDINKINNINDVLETTVTPDLLVAFNNYVKACIQNFKTIDKNDIIQEDYKDINTHLLNNLDIHETLQHDNIQETSNENNMLFTRTIKTKPNLDSFVKYTYKKQHDDIILPKIREINLDEPTLRNKGIKKKEKENNINIVYDENKKK